MQTPQVSVIILNYNGMQFLGRCLDSVLETRYQNVEIIAADNHSTDGSLEWVEAHYSHPRLRCVRLSMNWGFAGGNNRAAEFAQGKYLVFLNMDTEVEKDWLDQIVSIFESDERIGIIQSRLREMKNRCMLQSAGHYLDWLGICHVRGAGEEERGQYGAVEEVFGATGAAMAVRRSLFKHLGGFDSDYFCYFEETDLCWRAWLCGYTVVFAPNSVVYHYGGGASESSSGNKAQGSFLFIRNRITSFIKLLEWPLLLLWLPMNIMMLVAYGVWALIWQGEMNVLLALFKSILWSGAHLRRALYKRRDFKQYKVVSNWSLIRNGVIQPLDFRLLWHELREGK